MLGDYHQSGGSNTHTNGFRDADSSRKIVMAVEDRNTASIAELCLFGADVGCRLVQLVKWVDGMPSVVKSLGYEIWAACEVLCELSNILTRGQRNYRSTFFTAEAMREIEDYIETCDEVFHEAARGVLVAYDRIKALRPKANDKGKGKDKVGEFVDSLKHSQVEKTEKKPEPLQLSFQERLRWPLFQRRMFLMMEGLMNAKQDLTLHLLVYWVSWEHEHKKRSRSSVFSALSTSNRDSLVKQLWQAKIRREQDSDPRKLSLGIPRSVSSNGSSTPSIFALSNSGSQSPDDRRSYTASPVTTPTSEKSDRSLLSRLTRKLSLSSSRKKIASVSLPPKKKAPEPMTGQAQRSSANNTWNQRTVGMRPQMAPSRPSLLETASLASKSASNDMHSMHSARPGLHRSASTRSALRGNSPSSYSPTHAMSYRGNSPVGPPPSLSRKTSWSAGPTMGAKQGIDREWQALKGRRDYADDVDFSDDEEDSSTSSLPWSGTVDEFVQPDFRALGRQLLFRQFESMTPTWAVQDSGEHAGATVEMLVEQWIESGQSRRRRMDWESLVDGKRMGRYATSSSEGTLSSNSTGDGSGLKFHFTSR